MATVSIHPAQTADVNAEYDPMVPVPYPYHIEPDGAVGRQELWQGDPARLLGFQAEQDRQRVDLYTEDWLAGDHQRAVGMWPVFTKRGGGIYSLNRPIAKVAE